MPYVIKRGGLTYKYVNRGPDSELYHHGILGQKWGVRNGPPYPLSADRHSAAEKKAGYTKSISGGDEQKSNPATSSEAGGFRKNAQPKKDYSDTAYYLDSKVKDITNIGFKVKETPGTIEEDAKAVNPRYSSLSLTSKYTMNCTNCVMTYALRRMGLDVEAQPLSTGRQLADMQNYFKGCFDDKNCNVVNFNPKSDTSETVRKSVSEQCSKLCGDDAGVGFLAIQGPFMAHVFSWEKLDNGKVAFIDAQSNNVDDKVIEKYFSYVSKGRQLAPSILVTRLDNCEIDTSKLKEICKDH